MNIRITLYVKDFTMVNGKYEHVEIKKTGVCKNWDDLQNFVGYYTEIFGSAKFEIKPEQKEKE